MDATFSETLLVSLGLLLAFLGIIGAILPVLPGTLLGLLGLLIFQFIPSVASSWYIFVAFALAAAFGAVLDYVVPAIGAKKMGGTKWGIRGTVVGMLVGIAFSPFGLVSIFVMPFIGALVGELLYNRNEQKRAFRAALGSFLGFLVTTGFNLMLCVIIFAFLLHRVFSAI